MSRLDSLYTQVSAVGATTAPVKIQANLHDTALLFSQIRQGQVFGGEVVAKTDQSTYLIRIGQQLIELPLQEQLQNGDTLQFRLTNHTPEIRISVSLPGSGNSEAHQFQLEHIDGKVVFRELPSLHANKAFITEASIADLSKTGKLLDQLVSESSASKPGSMQLPAIHFDPQNPVSIQNSIENSMRNSGLFIYAHLRKILDGKSNIQDLAAELQQFRQSTEDHGSESAFSVIQNQLNVLEKNLISLYFSAPEGVKVTWNTQQQSRQSPGKDESKQPDIWLTEMELSFPVLGKVHVRISLADSQLILGCRTTTGYAEIFQQRISELQRSLQSTGVEPQIQISIEDAI